MTNEELLLTIAEIAVAFAGFASLISVIGKGVTEKLAVVASVLFRSMVLIALVVVVFALVPFLTHGFDLASTTAWRVASGISFIVGALGLYSGVRLLLHARAMVGPIKGTARLVVMVDVPAAIALTLFAFGTVGIGLRYIEDLYVAALLLYLLGAGVSFAALLFLHVHPISKPPSA